MPVGIRIFDEPQTQRYKTAGKLVTTEWSSDMTKAIRLAEHRAVFELKQGTPDHIRHRTLYAYDALGGLRFEARLRGTKITIRRT